MAACEGCPGVVPVMPGRVAADAGADDTSSSSEWWPLLHVPLLSALGGALPASKLSVSKRDTMKTQIFVGSVLGEVAYLDYLQPQAREPNTSLGPSWSVSAFRRAATGVTGVDWCGQLPDLSSPKFP
jgi:hypothetical protein